MSEENQESTENKAPKTKRPKKKRAVWNEKRRLSLLLCLLEEPANTEELFSKFREKENTAD